MSLLNIYHNITNYSRSKKSHELLSHSRNYLFAEFLSKSLTFISLPIITRLLSPDDFGVISIFVSIVAVFEIFFELNFRTTISRYYFEQNFDFPRFVGTNVSFITVVNLLFIAILIISRKFWTTFFKIDEAVFVYAIVVSGLMVYFNIFTSYLKASQQSREYAILASVRSIVILILTIVLIIMLSQNKYLGKIYAEVITMSVISIYALVKIIKISRFTFQKKYIKITFSYGLLLIPHALSSFILAQFDRVIINQLNGKVETGLYSFAYNVAMIMYVLILAMDMSWTPVFYKKMNEKKYSDINSITETYSKIIYFASVVLILFAKEIVFIMADKSYFSALSLVPVIVFGYLFVFLYTFYIKYSLYRKKTYLVSIVTIIAGAANIILNYALIPAYGYKIAAYTTVFSYALLFALHYFTVRFVLKEENRIKIKLITKYMILPVIAIGVFFILYHYNIPFFISLLIKVILTGGIVLLLWKNAITQFFTK